MLVGSGQLCGLELSLFKSIKFKDTSQPLSKSLYKVYQNPFCCSASTRREIHQDPAPGYAEDDCTHMFPRGNLYTLISDISDIYLLYIELDNQIGRLIDSYLGT